MFLNMSLVWSLSSPLPNFSYFFNQFNILLSIFRFYELLLDDCWVPQNVVQFLKRQNKSTIVISKSIYFSTAKLVQRLNNEINMLLYFREFLFFHTFSISFFSKCSSWIFKHNWMSNKTAASQDRPIVGRETLYFL